ncbi:phosphoribosylformylglycinamidine synthase subunit PurS, partial [Chloroflexota bacterium]
MHKVEVSLKSHLPDARGQGLVKDIADLGVSTVSDVRVIDIYWLDADLTSAELELICRGLLDDSVTQDYSSDSNLSVVEKLGFDRHVVEVAYNPGVADPVEASILKAIRDLGISGVRAVKTAKKYLIKGELSRQQLDIICNRLLINPVIQHVARGEAVAFPGKPQYEFRLETVDMMSLPAVLKQRFGFTDDEAKTIIAYF